MDIQYLSTSIRIGGDQANGHYKNNNIDKNVDDERTSFRLHLTTNLCTMCPTIHVH